MERHRRSSERASNSLNGVKNNIDMFLADNKSGITVGAKDAIIAGLLLVGVVLAFHLMEKIKAN